MFNKNKLIKKNKRKRKWRSKIKIFVNMKDQFSIHKKVKQSKKTQILLVRAFQHNKDNFQQKCLNNNLKKMNKCLNK